MNNYDDANDEVYCLSNIIDGCAICNGENLCVGCSDVEACNYSELVTIDDGSCHYIETYYNCDGSCILDSDGDDICDELEVLGCTNSTACNYNSKANLKSSFFIKFSTKNSSSGFFIVLNSDVC